MAPGVLSSACLVTGKPCRYRPLIRLIFDHPRHPSGVRTTCQFPLPGSKLASFCPTYARFLTLASCLKPQIRVYKPQLSSMWVMWWLRAT